MNLSERNGVHKSGKPNARAVDNGRGGSKASCMAFSCCSQLPCGFYARLLRSASTSRRVPLTDARLVRRPPCESPSPPCNTPSSRTPEFTSVGRTHRGLSSRTRLPAPCSLLPAPCSRPLCFKSRAADRACGTQERRRLRCPAMGAGGRRED